MQSFLFSSSVETSCFNRGPSFLNLSPARQRLACCAGSLPWLPSTGFAFLFARHQAQLTFFLLLPLARVAMSDLIGPWHYLENEFKVGWFQRFCAPTPTASRFLRGTRQALTSRRLLEAARGYVDKAERQTDDFHQTLLLLVLLLTSSTIALRISKTFLQVQRPRSDTWRTRSGSDTSEVLGWEKPSPPLVRTEHRPVAMTFPPCLFLANNPLTNAWAINPPPPGQCRCQMFPSLVRSIHHHPFPRLNVWARVVAWNKVVTSMNGHGACVDGGWVHGSIPAAHLIISTMLDNRPGGSDK